MGLPSLGDSESLAAPGFQLAPSPFLGRSGGAVSPDGTAWRIFLGRFGYAAWVSWQARACGQLFFSFFLFLMGLLSIRQRAPGKKMVGFWSVLFSPICLDPGKSSEAAMSVNSRNQSHLTHVPKSDLLTFWFPLSGPWLVMAQKVKPIMFGSYGQLSFLHVLAGYWFSVGLCGFYCISLVVVVFAPKETLPMRLVLGRQFRIGIQANYGDFRLRGGTFDFVFCWFGFLAPRSLSFWLLGQ